MPGSLASSWSTRQTRRPLTVTVNPTVVAVTVSPPRHEPRPAAGLLLLGDDQAAALELLAGLAEPGGASLSRVAAYQEDATP